jgi:hypothetical protein
MRKQQQNGTLTSCKNHRIDAWGTLNVIFMAALKPQHFMFEATSGHQNVISA